MRDIVNGLAFIHAMSVIHGDIKAVRQPSLSRMTLLISFIQSNILVDGRDKTAKIADFGLSTIITGTLTASSGLSGTARWMAPELCWDELGDPAPTPASDVYALAMTFWEVRIERS
jgi:serine/threonine protein kinase